MTAGFPTAWHTSPDALAILAGMERPRVEFVADALGRPGDGRECYVGSKVDALDEVFGRWLLANPTAKNIVWPQDVLAGLFGPADPYRVFADDSFERIAAEVRGALESERLAA